MNNKKNWRYENANCQTSETDNIQQDENAQAQNNARNELTTMTQFKNWLKAKKNHDEELWMQNQTNLNKVMNES